MTSILRTLSTNRLYLIALSGGADSIALALMMKELRLNVLALHCNFHLRSEESDRDEQFVRDFCHKHTIPLEVCHFDTLASASQHKTSIEMEARDLRYRWFAQRVQALDAEAICVARHKDDQAETLLLNLIRGTGLKGLAAMHPDRIVLLPLACHVGIQSQPDSGHICSLFKRKGENGKRKTASKREQKHARDAARSPPTSQWRLRPSRGTD